MNYRLPNYTTLPKDHLEELKRRVRVGFAAYQYELGYESKMSDAEWDKEALEIDVNKSCGCEILDAWHKRNFDPNTGVWARYHPMSDQFEIWQEIIEN